MAMPPGRLQRRARSRLVTPAATAEPAVAVVVLLAALLVAPASVVSCPYNPPGGGTTPAHCCNSAFDGDESDTDCGGGCSVVDQYACAVGATCSTNFDCYSRICIEGVCQLPSCVNCPGAWCYVPRRRPVF